MTRAITQLRRALPAVSIFLAAAPLAGTASAHHVHHRADLNTWSGPELDNGRPVSGSTVDISIPRGSKQVTLKSKELSQCDPAVTSANATVSGTAFTFECHTRLKKRITFHGEFRADNTKYEGVRLTANGEIRVDDKLYHTWNAGYTAWKVTALRDGRYHGGCVSVDPDPGPFPRPLPKVEHDLDFTVSKVNPTDPLSTPPTMSRVVLRRGTGPAASMVDLPNAGVDLNDGRFKTANSSVGYSLSLSPQGDSYMGILLRGALDQCGARWVSAS